MILSGASLKSRLNYVPNHVAMGIAVLLLAAVCVISGVVNLKVCLFFNAHFLRGYTPKQWFGSANSNDLTGSLVTF